MHVTGGHHRLVQLFPQLHDPAVYIAYVLHGLNIRMLWGQNHKAVVALRLDLQIVIEIGQTGNLRIRLALQQCPV